MRDSAPTISAQSKEGPFPLSRGGPSRFSEVFSFENALRFANALYDSNRSEFTQPFVPFTPSKPTPQWIIDRNRRQALHDESYWLRQRTL